jgi:predicted dienelactone hydrolase
MTRSPPRWRPRAATLLFLGGAALAAAALGDPLAVVAPLPPGTYPVGCSNIEQDFSRVQPGETAQQYWEGFPSGNQERYVDTLLVDPADVLRAGIAIPDDRELFVDRATTVVAYDFLVCYPTNAANPYPDYPLPTGNAVPHMQRGADPPLWPDATTHWPVLLFSHGLTGSPLTSEYLAALTYLASYGYVVVAPFHGDPRFADVNIENLSDAIYAALHFPTYVEMQAIRALSSAAALDVLLADPRYQARIDTNRIAGFGASLGGETLLLQAGAKLTITVGLSSKQVVADPRLKAIVGYVPYFGQPFFPAFGRDQNGLDGIAVPFLGISGTADTTAPVGPAIDGVEHLGGSRYLVTLEGVTHHFDVPSTNDIFTWTLIFTAAHALDDRAARAQIARMTSVAGGGDDRLLLDYTAPAQPLLSGEIRVIEYLNDLTGHYFITGNPAEAAALDAGPIAFWGRTGLEFKAFALGSGLGVDACRFFSAPALAPDTHFFTINANECAIVKSSPLWLYEGVAFEAQPPLGDGNCPPDRIPVTRLYNNGMNGQPNHRFLTSKSEAAEMQAEGWVLEGPVFCAAP